VASWSTKAAISLKRVKIEEKLLWTAYSNSSTLFRTVPSSTPYGLLFPKTEGSHSQPPSKTPIAIISETNETTDFKFGRCIHRVHPNKALKNFAEKGTWARIQGLHTFGYPLIISGSGKATNFRFFSKIFRAPI